MTVDAMVVAEQCVTEWVYLHVWAWWTNGKTKLAKSEPGSYCSKISLSDGVNALMPCVGGESKHGRSSRRSLRSPINGQPVGTHHVARFKLLTWVLHAFRMVAEGCATPDAIYES